MAKAVSDAAWNGKDIAQAMQKMDRPNLLRALGLEFDWVVVADIDGLHPLSLYAKSAKKIHSWHVPFLNEGVEGECCGGAVLRRFGHKTVALKCYETKLAKDASVCGHCEELWAMPDDDLVYALTDEMKRASALYEQGERKALKNWQGMKDMEGFFSDEVQKVKELLQGSTWELTKSWPFVFYHEAVKSFTNDAGVLFQDAGKSRNPHARSKREQHVICMYVQTLLPLWLRVRATVAGQDEWVDSMKALQKMAKQVARASTWALQSALPEDPVFVGSIVQADIMYAAFKFADSRFRLILDAIDRGVDHSPGAFSWGAHVNSFYDWADQQHAVSRPPFRSSPPSETGEASRLRTNSTASNTSHTSAASDSSRFDMEVEPKGKWWYGVGRGVVCGVYRQWKSAKLQVHKFSGARVKKFKSALLAEDYVQRVRITSVPAKWYVLRGSSRDGAYMSRAVAESYQGNSGEIRKTWSVAAAKEFIGSQRISIFNEESADTAAETMVGSASASTKSFYAVRGGSRNGVYSSVVQALQAMREGGGIYEIFDTKKAATSFADAASKSTSGERAYVVWAGRSTGVMSEAQMIAATKGFEAVIEGPLSFTEASTIWGSGSQVDPVDLSDSPPAIQHHTAHKAKAQPRSSAKKNAHATSSAAPASSGSAEAGDASTASRIIRAGSKQQVSVTAPSDEEFTQAVARGQKRVFACWTGEKSGRVAFSWEGAAEGVDDAVVKVEGLEGTVFLNFAKALQYFERKEPVTPQKSVAEMIAEARSTVKQRKAANATSSASAAASATSASTSSTATSTDKKDSSAASKKSMSGSGKRVGMSGVVRTREVTQIAACFVDADKAVKIQGLMFEPDDRDFLKLPAPGEVTYARKNLSVDAEGGQLSLQDYHAFCKSSVKAWPLKSFGEFMQFCSLAQRMCAESSKPVAAANAAVFLELSDIAVRAYNAMQRRNQLGKDQIRFKVRMYMQVQMATNDLVLHTSASALRVFDSWVDDFAAMKIPAYKMGNSAAKPWQRKSQYFTSQAAAQSSAKPLSGCWLCPSKEHYASDKSAHPARPDSLTDETKNAILARIDASTNSDADKKSEKEKVRAYWSQHSL